MIDERKVARDQIEKATLMMMTLEAAMYRVLDTACASPVVRTIVKEALAKCDLITAHRPNR